MDTRLFLDLCLLLFKIVPCPHQKYRMLVLGHVLSLVHDL